MSDHKKTKAELIQELTALRQEVARLKSQVGQSEPTTDPIDGGGLLTQAGDLLQPLLDNLPDWIFIKDAQSRIIRSNKAHAEVLGLDDPQEAVGKTDFDFFPPEDAERFYQEEQSFLEAGQPIIGRVGPTPAPNGEILWRSETKVPLRDDAGQVIGLIGVSRDVTDLKRAEIALRASESRYRALYTKTPAMLDSIDADGNVVDVSDYFLEVFGYERDEVIGQPVTKYMTAESREYAETVAIPTLIETGETRDLAYQYVKKNGEVIDALVSAVAEYDEAGNFTHSLAVLTDVTERKLAEESLRENQQRFEMVVDGSNEGLWDWNIPTNQVYFSPQWKAMIGYEDHEIANDFTEFERRLHPEDHERVMATVAGFMQGELASFEPEFRFQHKDGSYRWILARASLRRDEEGQPIRMAGSHLDITERKEAEEALRESQAQLSEALEIARLGYWEFDVERQAFAFNDQFYRLLRTTAEVEGGYLMPAPVFVQKFLHPDDAPRVAANIQNALETTDPNFSHEEVSRLIRADGEICHILVRFRIVKNETGETIRLIGANQDVSEQKQSEALLAKRAAELETVAQLSTQMASVLDPDQLLQTAVDLVKEGFDLYHAHIYLLDQADDRLNLAAGAGDVGRQMVAEGWSISLLREKSLVAQAARERQGAIVNDVQSDPSFLPNPLLPDTRSEMAIPMIAGDQLLGVLDVQADITDRFTDEDVRIKTTLAAQVAVALQNAQSYEQTQARARHEEILRQITGRVRGSTNPDAIVRAAVRELGTALGRPTFVRLGNAERLSKPAKAENSASPAGNGQDQGDE